LHINKKNVAAQDFHLSETGLLKISQCREMPHVYAYTGNEALFKGFVSLVCKFTAFVGAASKSLEIQFWGLILGGGGGAHMNVMIIRQWERLSWHDTYCIGLGNLGWCIQAD